MALYGALVISSVDNFIRPWAIARGANLPLLLTQKTRGGDEFLLPNERLLQTAFSSADNLRQLQLAVSGSPQATSIMERGTIDWLRSKNVVDADGLVDPKKIRQVLDKNKNIVEALPANVQMKLQDEVKFADDYVKRMGELDMRRVNAKDQELDSLLSRASTFLGSSRTVPQCSSQGTQTSIRCS
jgi:hypothetical protein